MTRVNTQVARKDYPEHGIKKGDTYYSWTPGFRGVKQRSLTPPKRSQLTANDKLSQVYSIDENLGEQLAACGDIDAVIDLLETSISDINDVAEQYRDSFENLPEGLQQSDTGQQLESNADELEAWASELDDLMTEVKDFDFVEFINENSDDKVPEGAKFDDLSDEAKELVMDEIREMVGSGNNCPL